MEGDLLGMEVEAVGGKKVMESIEEYTESRRSLMSSHGIMRYDLFFG
jgi:hypothetical protein